MEAIKKARPRLNKQNNFFASDKDIFVKVLEYQSSEYLSDIYFEIEKNNSIAHIFTVNENKDLASKLQKKKICC